MSNKFCRLLSNGYKIYARENQLMWAPCCYYPKKTNLLDKQAFEKALAYTSSATNWLPECAECQRMEFSGISALAPRQISFRRVPEDVENGICVDLEISFDIRCNAACVSCSELASSTWEKFNFKHKLTPIRPTPPDAANEYLQKLIDTVPMDQVRNLFMLGGEPFFSDSHIKLIQHIRKVHKNLDQVTLSYLTNGSIFPGPEVRELWKGFKEVVINFSIDGVGQRFEYLRWPLQWEQVNNVVNQFVTKTDVDLSVNCTVSPINILYVRELEDWLHRTIPENRLKLKTLRTNRSVFHMNLAMISYDYRTAIKQMYGKDHDVSKILTWLEPPYSPAAMVEYLDKIDRIRGVSWRDVFPDAVGYLTNS